MQFSKIACFLEYLAKFIPELFEQKNRSLAAHTSLGDCGPLSGFLCNTHKHVGAIVQESI